MSAAKPLKPLKPLKPRKRAQKLFRDWCAAHGACVDVLMAGDLVDRVTAEIVAAEQRGKDGGVK